MSEENSSSENSTEIKAPERSDFGSEVNPNSQVQAPTSDEMRSNNDGPLTFDELGHQDHAPKDDNKTDDSKVQAKSSDESDEDTEQPGDTGDADQDDGEADGSGTSEGESQEDDENQDQIKAIKAARGDEELELYGDTVVPTKVAGKLESPTLQDLRDNWAGYVNYDRKNNELHKREVDVRTKVEKQEQQLKQFDDYLNMVQESKNPFVLYDIIAQHQQKDPVELKMQAIKDQVSQVEHIAQMSENEREAYFKDLELKFREDKLKAVEQHQERERTQRAAVAEIEEVKSKFGISEGYGELLAQAKEIWEDPKPADVALYDRHMKAQTAVREAGSHWVEELDLTVDADGQPNNEFDTDQYLDFVENVRNHAMKHPQLSLDDLKGLVAKRLKPRGSKNTTAANLGRKVMKTQTQKDLSRGQNKNINMDNDGPLLSWDDPRV